jgi:transcriptional regulator with XRE-family HTH domain
MSTTDAAARLRAVLDDLGLTQADFARECDVSRSYVHKLTSGKMGPSERVLQHLLDRYRLSTTWLLFGEGPRHLNGAPAAPPAPPPPVPAPVVDAIRRLNEAAGLAAPEPGPPRYAKINALLQVAGSGPGGAERILRAEGYIAALAMTAQDEARALVDGIEAAGDPAAAVERRQKRSA